MRFDAEANILSWEIAKGEIHHVREFGNFIVHMTIAGKPVFIEILDASGFIGQLEKVKLPNNIKGPVPANLETL